MNFVTVSDVKKAGALLFNLPSGNYKNVTDEDIEKTADEIEKQTVLWLNSNGIDTRALNYNAKRLIVLETLINIAISYNISSGEDYIKTLREERDRYKKELEENMPRFSMKSKHVSPPRLKDGDVFR